MSVEFEDFSIEVKEALSDKAIAFLQEASAEIQAQVKRNTRVDTGQLKGSWDTFVDEEALKAYIGSPLENAIWEELGTGEYALNHDGRKTPWSYQDAKGAWHTTTGKKPSRALYNAFCELKPKIIAHGEAIFKELN